MAFGVKGLRRPKALLHILTETAKNGKVSYSQIKGILALHSAKSFIQHYQHFILKSKLLFEISEGVYSLTPYGLEVVHLAQIDTALGLRRMLGAYPPFRMYVQLRLAYLLLNNATWQPGQERAIWNRIEQTIPWFNRIVLPSIMKAIGWQDSSSGQDKGLFFKMLKIYGILDYIPNWLCDDWGQELGFKGLTDLTCSDNICRFLQEQTAFPVRVFSPEKEEIRTSLLLLILAQAIERAVRKTALTTVSTNILSDLAACGIQLLEDDTCGALLFPVETDSDPLLAAFGSIANNSYPFALEINSALDVVFPNNNWMNPLDILNDADLTKTANCLHQQLGEKSPFVFSSLVDGNHWQATSEILVHCDWQAPWDWQDKSLNFHQTAVGLAANGEDESQNLSPVVFSLSVPEALVTQGELEQLMVNSPYVYLLIMLLIDYEQSNLMPFLNQNVWSYSGKELIELLDYFLKTLGFTVWDDLYVGHLERRDEMGKQLVNILVSNHVAELHFGQLRLTTAFIDSLISDILLLSRHLRTAVNPHRLLFPEELL